MALEMKLKCSVEQYIGFIFIFLFLCFGLPLLLIHKQLEYNVYVSNITNQSVTLNITDIKLKKNQLEKLVIVYMYDGDNGIPNNIFINHFTNVTTFLFNITNLPSNTKFKLVISKDRQWVSNIVYFNTTI